MTASQVRRFLPMGLVALGVVLLIGAFGSLAARHIPFGSGIPRPGPSGMVGWSLATPDTGRACGPSTAQEVTIVFVSASLVAGLFYVGNRSTTPG